MTNLDTQLRVVTNRLIDATQTIDTLRRENADLEKEVEALRRGTAEGQEAMTTLDERLTKAIGEYEPYSDSMVEKLLNKIDELNLTVCAFEAEQANVYEARDRAEAEAANYRNQLDFFEGNL